MPDHPKHADLASLLDALIEADVEFIVVGGAAAVLHGAPVTTQDVDIVHRTDPGNVDRLMTLLASLEARIRDAAGRTIAPEREALSGTGQVRLTTNRGPLDLLCRLHDGRGYDDLLSHSEELSDGTLRLRVLDLAPLIDIKSASGRTRDQLTVPLLLALRRERES